MTKGMIIMMKTKTILASTSELNLYKVANNMCVSKARMINSMWCVTYNPNEREQENQGKRQESSRGVGVEIRMPMLHHLDEHQPSHHKHECRI